MKTIKDLCEEYGLGQTALAKRFEIPLRTVQNWHAGIRIPPEYVVNMMDELLQQDRRETYLIYKDSMDDACEIIGYIRGTEQDADDYCSGYNVGAKYEWQEATYSILKSLKVW